MGYHNNKINWKQQYLLWPLHILCYGSLFLLFWQITWKMSIFHVCHAKQITYGACDDCREFNYCGGKTVAWWRSILICEFGGCWYGLACGYDALNDKCKCFWASQRMNDRCQNLSLRFDDCVIVKGEGHLLLGAYSLMK